jgi:hypothetical protein
MISVVIPPEREDPGRPWPRWCLPPSRQSASDRRRWRFQRSTAEIATRPGPICAAAADAAVNSVPALRKRASLALFLHADTRLAPGWERDASLFMERVDIGEQPPAAAFRFALDDAGARPRVLERLVALRCAALRLPYGDQGLLIPKRLYDDVGGYRPLALMEDVDLVQRLGRRRTVMLRSQAVTSAERFRREGYARRSARNLLCLTLYTLRVPAHVISRIYG